MKGMRALSALAAGLLAVLLVLAFAGATYASKEGPPAVHQERVQEEHRHLGQGQPQHEEREQHRFQEREERRWQDRQSVRERVYRGVENALLRVKNPVARAALEAIRDGKSVSEAVYAAKPLLENWSEEYRGEALEVAALLGEALGADDSLDEEARALLAKWIGKALRKLGNPHEAKRLLEETVSRLTQDEEAYQELDKAYAGIGDRAVKVYLQGRQLAFDVPPRVENGRTLVPVRVLAERLGATVSYENGLVVIAHRGAKVVLTVGSNEAWVGSRLVLLDVPATIVEGRTLVPLRFVGEGLGAKVIYYPESNLIAIRGEAPEN